MLLKSEANYSYRLLQPGSVHGKRHSKQALDWNTEPNQISPLLTKHIFLGSTCTNTLKHYEELHELDPQEETTLILHWRYITWKKTLNMFTEGIQWCNNWKKIGFDVFRNWTTETMHIKSLWLPTSSPSQCFYVSNIEDRRLMPFQLKWHSDWKRAVLSAISFWCNFTLIFQSKKSR